MRTDTSSDCMMSINGGTVLKGIERIVAVTVLGFAVCVARGVTEESYNPLQDPSPLNFPFHLDVQLYNRAPEALPGIPHPMRNPSYWIGRMEHPDEVILTPEAIKRMNGDYERRMASPDPFSGVDPYRIPPSEALNQWPGRFITMPDIDAMTPERIAGIVREEIGRDIDFMRGRYILLSSPQITEISGRKTGDDIEYMSEEYLKRVPGLPEDFAGQIYGNILGIQFGGRELDELELEMALDRVPDAVAVLDGITVRDARLRIVPTIKPEHIGHNGNWTPRWDIWNVNIVRIASPVSVHATR